MTLGPDVLYACVDTELEWTYRQTYGYYFMKLDDMQKRFVPNINLNITKS